MLNQALLTTIALTGFTVAFFHAAIPTHWLPFVATGRAQRWTRRKTLAVTALAGGGHVLATATLGLILTVFGVAINARLSALFPWIAGGLLTALGLFYLGRQMRGHNHVHEHHHHKHRAAGAERSESEHGHSPSARQCGHIGNQTTGVAIEQSDRWAITSLFAMLTFSPCEGFLPIYVSGIRFGWIGFTCLTVILSLATLAGMLLFTSLALAGVRSLRLSWLERRENGIIGTLLVIIGLLVILFEH